MQRLALAGHSVYNGASMTKMILAIVALLIPIAHAQEPAEQLSEENSTQQIRETFAFESNEDPGRIVLAATLDSLDADSLYQFNVDTNQDGIEDRVIQVTLGSLEPQKAMVTGPSVPERTGSTISLVKADSLSGLVSAHASPEILSERGNPVRAFVGVRDNPAAGPEADDKNVQVIAIELPLDLILAENKSDFNFWVSIYQKN